MRLPRRERGIALVTSMLLLVIITILAVSMFRTFGTQERIAGNVREKERALHAATSAQQYAEWWLIYGNNAATGAIPCAQTIVATSTEGQICNQPPITAFGGGSAAAGYAQLVAPNPAWPIQVTFQPQNMVLIGAAVPAGNTNPPYFAYPGFWIYDAGIAADGAGEAYQIDAYGYGGSQGALAVVESTYEVQQGVVNRGSL
ncbi:MAG: hypothetical protein JSS29_00965 [Proteobacteria bacterium]|nr:hypothetical protein [Pseudomonadota bacterium]